MMKIRKTFLKRFLQQSSFLTDNLYLPNDKMKRGGYGLVTGYVFIDTEKGRALEVASEVVKIKGVKTACAITGTFDVIATFEVKDVNDIGEMVASARMLSKGL